MNKLIYLLILVLLLVGNTTSVFAVSTSKKITKFNVLINDKEFVLSKDVLSKWLIENPHIVYFSNYISEVENIDFVTQLEMPYELTSRLADRFHKKKISTFEINDKSIQKYVQDIAKQVESLPINAELAITSDNKVIISKPDKSGLSLDIKKSVEIIKESLKNGKKVASLKVVKKLANIRVENFSDLGLNEVIGEGRSNFSGSTSSRIHNIKTAASKFKGLLIPPGKEFSFLDNLGPVDGENGYKKELVIKNNQTIPEYGGGTCQVSTTIFRGAIFSGLKVTERKNHSYPVHYYLPIGFDATVYIPAPDMKFINNTSKYIMLDTLVEGNELVFKFYGTNDNRKVEMKGPIVTERKPDGAMKTYFIQKVTDAKGNIMINDTFYSNYKSPNDYPRPGQEKFTVKPKNWSKKQWKSYKQEHGL